MKETGGIIPVVLFRSYLEPYSTHPFFNDLFFYLLTVLFILYTGGNTSLVIFFFLTTSTENVIPLQVTGQIVTSSEGHQNFFSLAKLVTSLDKLNVL